MDGNRDSQLAADEIALLHRVSASREIDPVALCKTLLSARAAMIADRTVESVVEEGIPRELAVTRIGSGPLRTAAGDCQQVEFRTSDRWEGCTALLFGELEGDEQLRADGEPVTLRIDSGCATGQLFGDTTCDCAAQLRAGLQAVAAARRGVLLHFAAQDGRGFGTSFKLAALRLQALGLDTIEASELLTHGGVGYDRRTYSGAIAVLRRVGVDPQRSLTLLSANPAKARALAENGYDVRLRPLEVDCGPAAQRNLVAKRRRLGHVAMPQTIGRSVT